MNHWQTVVIAAVAGFVLSVLWSTLALRQHKASVRAGSVTLTQQRRRVYIGLLLTILPFLMFIRLPKSHEIAGFALVVAIGVGMGLMVLVLALRRFVFSRQGIELVGFRGFFMPWDEVASVESKDNGLMKVLHFASTSRGKIVVDNSLVGWHELLEELPNLASGKAESMVSQAVSELKRWDRT